jgi:hypothetical protein
MGRPGTAAIRGHRIRPCIKRVAFTDQIGQNLARMRNSWLFGVDVDPGPRITGAGAGTLVQDWDDAPTTHQP